jgi:hypothetical protein
MVSMKFDIDNHQYGCHIDRRRYSKESTEMSEAYLTNWLAGHQDDQRNHFHEIAIHEARIASDLRGRPATPARTSGLVDRLRAVLTGVAPAERCDCPAAA